MGVGGQCNAPATLPPGRIWYPLYIRLGRPQGQSGRVQKISPPLGLDPQTVQPVVSRYTSCAIPAHTHYLGIPIKVPSMVHDISFRYSEDLIAPNMMSS